MPEANASKVAAKANQLYWGTSRPAGQLADELGISRSKFYALVEPLKLDVECPECGESLAFSSRSDREAGRGRCPECGAQSEIAEDERPAAPPPRQRRTAEAREWSALDVWRDLPGDRQLWLVAIVGVAAGLLLTGWWRRR
jgi:endogenous inhibitor of DNA gyrase (YacG/DUF329 family)